jgi:hypothetical protein
MRVVLAKIPMLNLLPRNSALEAGLMSRVVSVHDQSLKPHVDYLTAQLFSLTARTM